jgi:hypothetical protein
MFARPAGAVVALTSCLVVLAAPAYAGKDRTAPQTTITAQPANPTTSTSASFGFVASEPATFGCRLDGSAFGRCLSPKAYSSLKVGSHTFQVRARDLAGNTDSTPASYTWQITAPATTSTSTTAATVAVPVTIASDCSVSVEAALNAFLATVPNGVTVKFAPGGCYAQAGRIELRDKTDVTIDGQGATFRSSTENTALKGAVPNWMLLRGRNVRIKNMTVVGNFHLTGTRSQQRVNQLSTEGEAGATSQFNAGVAVYGGDGVWVTDMSIQDVFGDGVLTGMSEYVENSAPFEHPANVHVERVRVSKAARHCFSPNQVDGFWLEDSTASDCWYEAVDAELDGTDQTLRNLHFLRNTFDGYLMGGIVIPVAGDAGSTRDIEIRGNTFLTRPDNLCNDVILVGAYPSNPNLFGNVVVEQNTIPTSGLAVHFDHVAGGSIQGNTLNYIEAGCAYPNVSPTVRVDNSSGVTVASNGP